MFKNFLIFVCLISFSHTDSVEDNNIQLFEDFIVKYNKTYNSTTDFLNRFYIFQHNLERINYVNDKSNNFSYRLGINRFTDLTSHEFTSMYKGYNGINYEDINKYEKHYLTIPGNKKWNKYQTIDWRSEGLVSNVKDQGQCGSCWAFSAVATMEGAWSKSNGTMVSLSEQDLVDCVSGCEGCDGGWPYMAIDWVINGSSNGTVVNNQSGIDTESSYPYMGIDESCNFSKSNIKTSFQNMVRIPSGNVLYLMDALLSVGPISVVIDAEGDFQLYESGVFESSECSKTELDHAVIAVGYGVTSKGKTYYIIKNSWGTDWGMDGYIYFSADIPNMCGIAQDACYAVA